MAPKVRTLDTPRGTRFYFRLTGESPVAVWVYTKNSNHGFWHLTRYNEGVFDADWLRAWADENLKE